MQVFIAALQIKEPQTDTNGAVILRGHSFVSSARGLIENALLQQYNRPRTVRDVYQ